MAVVQLNDLVISRICSFLPVSDLKAVRLLNSTWKRGAASSFRQKSRIQLHLTAGEDGVAKLEKCLSELNHLQDCLNLGIDIKEGENSQLEPFISLCRYACTRLFQSGIVSLKLANKVWDKELRMSLLIGDLLHHFSPNLEYLELDLVFGDVKKVPPRLMKLRSADNLSFPKLKVFKDMTVRFRRYETEGENELTPLYSKLFHPDAAPKLEVVKMWEPHYFFRRLGQDQNTLHKLTTLEICKSIGDNELKLLTKCNWKLTTLSLSVWYLYDEETLQLLFEKIRPSMEHLTLDFVEGVIVIPSCPKLKTLSICFTVSECLVDGRSGFCVPHPGLEFEVTDSMYFPVLEVLTVKIINEHGIIVDFEETPNYHDYLRRVFPEEGVDVFRSLRTLRVPMDWEVVDQDFRARLPPEVQIYYIPEDEMYEQ